MKKFAIMFVMLLGSVATMQAQSFSFSCATPGVDSWTELSEGFTPVQMESLTTAGFEEELDGNGNERLSKLEVNPMVMISTGLVPFNGNYDVSVQVGMFYDGRDDSAAALGPFTYRIRNARSFGSLDFENDIQAVIALLNP